jgi:hypothetical protein
VAAHRAIHETVYSDSTLRNAAPDVDRLSDDIAVLHVWSRLTAGPAHGGATPARGVIQPRPLSAHPAFAGVSA